MVINLMTTILLMLYSGLPVGIVPSLICSLWWVDLWPNTRVCCYCSTGRNITCMLAACQEDWPFSVRDRRQRSRRLSIMEHWRKDNEWITGVFCWAVSSMHCISGVVYLGLTCLLMCSSMNVIHSRMSNPSSKAVTVVEKDTCFNIQGWITLYSNNVFQYCTAIL